MERREALKSMAFAVWGLILLPGCNVGGSTEVIQEGSPLSLNSTQSHALKYAVDTIIPTTDTPGAVDLDVHRFVEKILAHCYEPEVREDFIKGLNVLQEKSQKEFKKEFQEVSKDERIKILESLENSEDEIPETFFSLIKELTILGYSTTEYVMKNLTNYTMTPGHFYGCVPLKT